MSAQPFRCEPWIRTGSEEKCNIWQNEITWTIVSQSEQENTIFGCPTQRGVSTFNIYNLLSGAFKLLTYSGTNKITPGDNETN